MTFAEAGVHPELIAALSKQRITVPTAIQVAALPVLLAGKDVYLNSETGTGKTLAYLLPIFGRLDLARGATQSVILAPTHELAIQIQRQATDLAQNAGWPVRVLLLIGGTALDRQIEKLKKKPHVVVGSPGRILELLRARKLKTQAITSVVVDETDRLLVAERLPEVRAILAAAPPGRQLIFASATEREESTAALATLAPGLVVVRTGGGSVNPNIEHAYLVCEERDKPDVLRKLIHAIRPVRAMVFVHRNEVGETLAARLVHHHLAAAALHGAADKADRKRAMDEFRAGRVEVLVTSDVAARGLDIADVTHIFNFDVPTQSKDYLHRVGRTARAGAKGYAITLLSEIEVSRVRRLESELGIVMQRVILREGRVIAAGGPGRDDQRARAVTKRR